MRVLTFAGRTIKEILRDPLNLAFGLGLPIILLVMMSAIQKNIPVDIFEISKLTPGIAVFSNSFLTLFVASVIAKDRESALLVRLYTTPMKAHEFLIGYALPLIPVWLIQTLLCYIVAFMFGLPFTVNVLYSIASSLIVALFFVSLGLLLGSMLSLKAVGGICGAVVTNCTALLSGAWIDLSLMGKGMETFAYCLPFANCTALEQDILAGTYDGTLLHFVVLMIYLVACSVGAVLVFLRQMKHN